MRKFLLAFAVLLVTSQAHAQIEGGVGQATGQVASSQTGSIFSDDTPAAIIQRLADRVLIGGAVVTDGKRFPVTSTWVAKQAAGFMTYFDSRSTHEVVSSFGATAIAAASRTSDMNPVDTGTIGYLGFALNDYQDSVQANRRSAWGSYTHVVRAADSSTATGTGGNGGVASNQFTFSPIPGTGPVVGSGITWSGATIDTFVTAYNSGTGVVTFSGLVPQAIANGTTITFSTGATIAGGIQGMEMDVANQGSVVQVDPYGGGTSKTGMTLNLLLGSGGETGFAGLTVNPASAALMVANNHGQYMKGIVIGANAIYGTDGLTASTSAPAIVMARGHEIQWRYGGGDVTPAMSATIRSDNNALSTSSKLIFKPNGVSFTDQFENQAFRIQPAATTAGQFTNYIAFIGAVAASGTPSPILAATGNDATIGMDFQTTGQGVYNFYSRSKTRLLARITDSGSLNAGGNSILINANDSGGAPSVAAGGVDTNVNLGLVAKGSGIITNNAPMQLKSYTVATLPTCAAATQDTMAVVTDATSPTYNGALTGSGAVRVPVYCNGTSWSAH